MLLGAAEAAARAPEAERPARRRFLARAVRRVAGMGGEPVAAALRRMAGDASPAVRAAAAEGIALYPERIFADELVKLAADADANVMSPVCEALSGHYFRSWAGKALAERLLGGGSRERLLTLRAMSRSNAPQGAAEHFETLARLAAGNGEDAALARKVLIEAGGSPRTVGWLLAEIETPDRFRRQAVRNRLYRNLHDPRVLAAMAKLPPGDVKTGPAKPDPQKPPDPPEVF